MKTQTEAGSAPVVGQVEREVRPPVPERAEGGAIRQAKHQYLRELRELQELARSAPYVTDNWVRQVSCMDEMDMRRRLIRSADWHGHFAHSLDGIPQIQNLPGAGIDGCRSHKEVRAVVLGLLEQIDRLKRPNGEGERNPGAC